METFSALLTICAGNSAVAGEFPAQSWVLNNREAGDLRRHRAHYDVTVMVMMESQDTSPYTIIIQRHHDVASFSANGSAAVHVYAL